MYSFISKHVVFPLETISLNLFENRITKPDPQHSKPTQPNPDARLDKLNVDFT